MLHLLKTCHYSLPYQVFIFLQKADAYLTGTEVLFASYTGTIVVERERISTVEPGTSNIKTIACV